MSEKQCKGYITITRFHKEPCPRTVVEGTDWCIFHYPNKKGELAERFEMEYPKERKRQEDEHPNYLDFTGFDFPNEISFHDNLPTIFLNSTVFRNKVEFFTTEAVKNVRLFVKFSETTVNGDAWFNDAIFKGEAMFNGAIFKGNAWFNKAIFNGVAMFGGAIFNGEALFRGATFNGASKFSGATFKGATEFSNATFVGTTEFLHLTLFKAFYLAGINVKNNFYLEVNKWSSITSKEGTINLIQLWEPTLEGIGKIIVKGTLGVYNDNLIAGLSLLNTELDRFEFIDADWIHHYNRQTVIDEHILNNDIKEISSPGEVAQIYRRLRENYEKAKRYSDAGDFYVGEMEVLRNNLGGNKYLQFKWWLYSIYFYLSKYGESITLSLGYSLVLILLFAGIRVVYSPSISATTLQGFIEALSDSFLAYVQLRSKTTIDLYQRVLSAPLLAMAAVAIKRTLDRK